jgi:DNA-binding MarR family transcriptional regulator
MAARGLASIDDILNRIDTLLRIVDEVPEPDFSPAAVEAEVVEAAYRALKAEQERAQLFGADMFPNPGWAILLHLFVSGAEGRHVNSAGLCAPAGVPETVALRHLAVLVAAKLVRRQPHHSSADSIYLALTPEGKKRLCDYFSRAPRDRDAAAA